MASFLGKCGESPSALDRSPSNIICRAVYDSHLFNGASGDVKKSIVPKSTCATTSESEVVALAHSHLFRCMSKVLPGPVPLGGRGLFILF